MDKLGLASYDVCIIFCGKEACAEEAGKIESYINSKYPGKEVYVIDGGQDVYDYILVVE